MSTQLDLPMSTQLDLPVICGPASAERSSTFDQLRQQDTPDTHNTHVVDPDDTEPSRDDGYLTRARYLAEHHRTPTSLARLAKAELDWGNRVSAATAAHQAAGYVEFHGDPAAMMVVANVLSDCGEHEAAESILSNAEHPIVRALTAPLAARLAVRRGDLDGARKLLTGSTSAVALEMSAVIAIQQHDFRAAISLLRYAIRDEVATPDAYINLSYAFACAGSPKKALRAARTGFMLAPTSRVAGINLVTSLREFGHKPEAAAVLDSLLTVHPHDARLHLAKAELLVYDDRGLKALETLSELRSAPWFSQGPQVYISELMAFRAVVKHHLRKSSRRETYTEIRTALQRCNFESEYVARQLGDFATTSADIEDLNDAMMFIEHGSHDGEAVCNLRTRIAWLVGDTPATATALREWTDKFPADTSGWTFGSFFGLIHLDPTMSEHFALEGLKRFPQNLILANNVAFARALRGDAEGARRVLPRQTRVGPRATAAAIEIASGNVDAGIALYDHLAQQLDQGKTTAEALSVRLWRNVTLALLTDRELTTVRVPYDQRDDVSTTRLVELAVQARAHRVSQ